MFTRLNVFVMIYSITIDSINFKVRSKTTILQACELVNISIPRFCYHERLSIAGNCRMCLVEIIKLPKLQASCAVPLSDNMIIYTKSPLVLKAREGVLEFLLINHPLDCPICDQGGECDLQDQSLFYGSDKNRFKEFKRAVGDKYCGPLIKTVMTRCIHCTRCIRFANEIIGVPDLGTSGRGNSIEISFYIEKLFFSELSGNVIDLCPVGALTSKPYAFLSRPWELKSIESIDILDSIHSNIKIDVRGYDIVRVLPRIHESINKEWISDKIRFAFDGLLYQRLTTPLLRNNQGHFDIISWSDAVSLLNKKITYKMDKIPQNIGLFIGPFCDFESLIYIKKLIHLSNSNVYNHDCLLDSDFNSLFKFNTFLDGIAKSDLCLILGMDPRIDGVLLSYYLRKRYLQGNFKVAYIGSCLNLMFPTYHLGCSINNFFSLLEGNNNFCQHLRKSRKPLIIVGKSLHNKVRSMNFNMLSSSILSNLNINDSWNVFNFFNSNSKDFCLYDLSLNHNHSLVKNRLDITFIIEDFKSLDIFSRSTFTVFLGHHGCLNAQKSDLILPTTSFTERTALFGNCEGRYQYSHFAVPPLGLSKDSSAFISNIIDNYSYISGICCIETFESYLACLLPSFNYSIGKIHSNFFIDSFFLYNFITIDNSYVFSSFSDNFYKTDIISQCSLNMSKSSKELLNKIPFNL